MECPFPVMCRVAERCLSLENVVTDFFFPNDMPVKIVKRKLCCVCVCSCFY